MLSPITLVGYDTVISTCRVLPYRFSTLPLDSLTIRACRQEQCFFSALRVSSGQTYPRLEPTAMTPNDTKASRSLLTYRRTWEQSTLSRGGCQAPSLVSAAAFFVSFSRPWKQYLTDYFSRQDFFRFILLNDYNGLADWHDALGYSVNRSSHNDSPRYKKHGIGIALIGCSGVRLAAMANAPCSLKATRRGLGCCLPCRAVRHVGQCGLGSSG